MSIDECDEVTLESLARSVEKLSSSYGDLRNQMYLEVQTVRADLRNKANRAEERAELITSLLMYFRGNGKMPRNWRRLTIEELVAFSTTLPRVESLGELSEIPIMSQSEADFIRMMETLAKCSMNKKELPAHSPCAWWWRLDPFWTLLRKAKAMLKVRE